MGDPPDQPLPSPPPKQQGRESESRRWAAGTPAVLRPRWTLPSLPLPPVCQGLQDAGRFQEGGVGEP